MDFFISFKQGKICEGGLHQLDLYSVVTISFFSLTGAVVCWK